MITSARFSIWETNSSTVNQLVIPLDEKIEIPENTKLVIRLFDVFKKYDPRDGAIFKKPQEKLDIFVSAVVQYCDYEETSSSIAILLMSSMYEMLDSANIQYEIDLNSFKNIRYHDFSSEIIVGLTDILFRKNKKLFLNYIFKGHFAVDDEGIVYDGDSEFILDKEENKDKYIITE